MMWPRRPPVQRRHRQGRAWRSLLLQARRERDVSDVSASSVDTFRQPDLQTMRAVGDEVPLGLHPVLDHVMWCAQHFGFCMAEFGGEDLHGYGVYTVGLAQYGHLDFILFGVPPEGARLVLRPWGAKSSTSAGPSTAAASCTESMPRPTASRASRCTSESVC